ncbi:MAG: ferritin family protein [Sedimentisphaerales bacterium]|nr:ferritin family protein [Sedimentisphaerales bacterium]
MKYFNTVDKILDFAMDEEMRAYRWYMELSELANNPSMQKAFEEFAQEELAHKAKLEGIRKGNQWIGISSGQEVTDLKLAEIVDEPEPTADMTYQDALRLAMKKEKAAFLMYTSLAELCEDAKLEQVFRSLAAEEAKHKLRFEVEYDEIVMKEN